LQPFLPHSLAAAQFRFLNEKLYTTTSDAAWTMFQKDTTSFVSKYHRGFRSQVEVLPVNPLDIIIQSLKSYLPASRGSPAVRKVGANTVKIWSFDLCEDSKGWVTACDIKKGVPPPLSSVDVAVFCLSLMGANYIDFVKEATRLLKTGGTLKIAEVISRFSNAANNPVTKDPQDTSNKMFVLFYFVKRSAGGKSTGDIYAPPLKPCVYKKR
ncbi:hypothetical protein M427DRAFT_99762, partial [Gonapodya prolifera JEL478]